MIAQKKSKGRVEDRKRPAWVKFILKPIQIEVILRGIGYMQESFASTDQYGDAIAQILRKDSRIVKRYVSIIPKIETAITQLQFVIEVLSRIRFSLDGVELNVITPSGLYGKQLTTVRANEYLKEMNNCSCESNSFNIAYEMLNEMGYSEFTQSWSKVYEKIAIDKMNKFNSRRQKRVMSGT